MQVAINGVDTMEVSNGQYKFITQSIHLHVAFGVYTKISKGGVSIPPKESVAKVVGRSRGRAAPLVYIILIAE